MPRIVPQWSVARLFWRTKVKGLAQPCLHPFLSFEGVVWRVLTPSQVSEDQSVAGLSRSSFRSRSVDRVGRVIRRRVSLSNGRCLPSSELVEK